MRKYIIILLILLLTGCSVVRIDTSNIDTIVDVILSKENRLYNTEGIGYHYYIPRGVTHIETDEQTEKLYCDGDFYYLFVDTVSYYYKVKQKNVDSSNAYYFREIDNNGKGYLKITKNNELYYIDFYYNYAKIEAVVTKDKLNQAVLNSSYILSTVKYNKKIVNLMLEDDYFTNKAGKYKLFENATKSNKFELKTEEETK